jgi:error-prone DNA polymerase
MYAELHAFTCFSFLKGASTPTEMVSTAAAHGYRAIAITDECSFAGVVRAHETAKRCGVPLIVGAELPCEDGLTVVALSQSRRGYGRLSQLITKARRAAEKGSFLLKRDDLTMLEENLLLWIPGLKPSRSDGAWLRERFERRLWLGVHLHRTGNDAQRLAQLQQLASKLEIPTAACSGALMHDADRKSLHDVVTAIRLKTPVRECGYALQPNSERRLRSLEELQRLYPAELLRETVHIAEQCHFNLEELRYEYPRELVPDGETPASWLRKLTERGAKKRWPGGVPPMAADLIEHELKLIAELRYEPYFLTVYDLVREARERGILCQGRGSAANSVVCYSLGVTAVDPSRQQVLFERFLSKE